MNNNVEKRFEDNNQIINEEEKFYKKHENDSIWWVDNHEEKGKMEFSFDKVKIYNLYKDYPHNLTPEEKEIFDKENPYWKDYFKDRQDIEQTTVVSEILENDITDEQLKRLIANEKRNEYVDLSEWYGNGKNSGYNGLILNLDTLEVKEYKSEGFFEGGSVKTKANIKKIGKIKESTKNILDNYIHNDCIFKLNKAEFECFDAGTNIIIKYGDINCELINCDKNYSSNTFKYYNILFEIIKSNLDEIDKTEDNDVKKNNQDIFSEFKDLDFNGLINLRLHKKQQLDDIINNVATDENKGFDFWSMKMMLENIKLIDSKIVNKFSTNLSAEEINNYNLEIQLLSESVFSNVSAIRNALDKLI